VKALEVIKKGSFVTEYVGEVITSEEAEQRGKKYGIMSFEKELSFLRNCVPFSFTLTHKPI